MPDTTLWIRACPEPLTPDQLADDALANEVVLDLGDRARGFGPYHLAAWARRQGLEVVFVDDSWVRVPVDGDDLAAFLREVLGAEPETVGAATDPDQRYLIEAEEF